ncbi:MAG: hypothetical protein ACRDX9_08950 [Acidimicrobiia bacterium]
MNIEDQVAAMFAKANPVPSLELLDPIEPVDMDSFRDRSERRGEMPDLKTITATNSRFGRPELKTIPATDLRPGRQWLAPAMAAIAILVVAIPILIGVTPLGSNPTPAEQVASAFMDAVNEHDGLAIRGMYALEDLELKWNPDLWPAVTDLNRALGFEYSDVTCVERPPISYAGTETTPVECSSTLQQDLTTALGLEATEATYTLYVSDGELMRALETWRASGGMAQALREFRAWVLQNHPDDYWTMYSSPTNSRRTVLYADHHVSVEPESLALWERYVDEFVAEHEG